MTIQWNAWPEELMQGLLDGAALALLVDGEWLRLDLAGCSKLGDAALQPALPQLPSLQALDLSGCSATASTLRSLPAACPNLAVLRLGAFQCFAWTFVRQHEVSSPCA